MPIWVWVALAVLVVVALLGGTVAVTLAATGRAPASTASPSPAAPTPSVPRTVSMPDYRGWTLQNAINDLNSVGLGLTMSNPANANQIVLSQTPAPGTPINAYSTGFNLYTYNAPTAPSTEPTAPADPNTFSAGTYEVGSEIQPGTYKTSGSDFCYYARLRSLDGNVGAIIANDNVSGQGVMEVKSSDKYVKFDGTCTWTKK